MSRFINYGEKERLCPKCGSRSRSRRLYSLIEHELEGKRILHFSAPRSLDKRLKEFSGIDYVSTDYVGEFKAMKRLNIECIDEPDSSYDLVICYHVLEHIEKDENAIRELYRILRPNGKAFIQTPFKDGDIYEDPSIQSEEERLKHFGQKDHVRIYSAQGLITRLESVGFNTQLKEFKEEPDNRYGFSEMERVVIASKDLSNDN